MTDWYFIGEGIAFALVFILWYLVDFIRDRFAL
jgi:hypothetical protein